MWADPVVTMIASAIGTGMVLRYAKARALLDHPNERSSHSVPTPRGGGLAFVVVILAVIALGAGSGSIAGRTAAALVPAGALVAAIGWLDDRRGLSALTRFFWYAVAACWLVAWLGPVTTLTIGTDGVLHLGVTAWPLTILALVWLANAFNFMDGIDGIAGGMALVAGAWGAILSAQGGAVEAAWVALLVAGGAAGFLRWNWMPARIFMGDVGSVFLGLMLGAVGLMADRSGALPAPLWALVLGPFLVDTTVTLVRRVLRGEAWFSAHRSHAYQRAVQSGWSHAQVTSATVLLAGLMGLLVWIGRAHPRLASSLVAAGVLVLLLAYVGVERRRPMGL